MAHTVANSPGNFFVKNRKPTQEMWAKMLFVAILVLGLASVPRVAVGKFRMRQFHIVA